MRHAIALLPLVCLTACATRTLHLLTADGRASRDTATFRVPHGWTARTNIEFDRNAWGLAPEKSTGAPRCSIGLRYHELWPDQAGDQQAQADSYLEGIHRHSDGKVAMSVTDTFRSRTGEALRVYRYFSDYWRDRRSVFVVRGNRFVHVTLYADDPADAQRCQPILEEVAGSVSVP